MEIAVEELGVEAIAATEDAASVAAPALEEAIATGLHRVVYLVELYPFQFVPTT